MHTSRRRILGVLVAACALLLGLPASPAAAIGTNYSWVANVNSGACMDDPGWQTSNGAPVDQWGCNYGDANQTWVFWYDGGGLWEIVNNQSGKCLDVPGFTTTWGAQLDQWGCNGGNNQKFYFTQVTLSDGTTAWSIASFVDNLCVEVSGFSTTWGAAVDQWGCNRGTNQLWKVDPSLLIH